MGTHAPVTPEQLQAAARKHRTIREMADNLGISRWQCTRLLDEHNIELSEPPHRGRPPSSSRLAGSPHAPATDAAVATSRLSADTPRPSSRSAQEGRIYFYEDAPTALPRQFMATHAPSRSMFFEEETRPPQIQAADLDKQYVLLICEREPREYPIISTKLIGRGSEADICILYDPAVSREHAEVQMAAGILFIVDIKSRNGTFVNNARVSHRLRLHAGDRIRVGDTDILVGYSKTTENTQSTEAAPRQEQSFSARLLEWRRSKGWTQEKLAEILEVSQTMVSSWERDTPMADKHLEKLRLEGFSISNLPPCGHDRD